MCTFVHTGSPKAFSNPEVAPMNASKFRCSCIPALLAVLVITASGCGKDAAPTASSKPASELTPQASDDIARTFAASLAKDGGVPIDRVGGTTINAIAEGRARGIRAGMENTADEGEFSFSFRIRFFDRHGVEQPAYDPQTTARMSVEARAHGRVVTAEQRAEVGVARWLDVGGLLPSEVALEIDGASHDTADCEFAARDGSAERRYHLLAGGVLTDVLKLKDERVNPYPLSGTARWDVEADAFVRDASGTSQARYEATVIVTFNGTKHPTIEVNKRWRYRMDLETGEVVRQPA
jgi:hypothetical protein